jgi:hypothetical protein
MARESHRFSWITWVLGIVAVVLIGVGAVLALRSRGGEIRLLFDGPAGATAIGHYVADGQRHEIDVPLPAGVEFTARSMDFEVRLAPGSAGPLKVTVFADDWEALDRSVNDESERIRGYLRYGWWGLEDGGMGG